MGSRGLEGWLRSKAFDIKTEWSEFKSQVPVKIPVNYGGPFVISFSRSSLSEMITGTNQLAKLPNRRVWGSKRDPALIYKVDSHCRRFLGLTSGLCMHLHTQAHSHTYIQTLHTNMYKNQTVIWETVSKDWFFSHSKNLGGVYSESRERESDLPHVSHKGSKQMFLNMQGLRKYNS